MPKHCPSCGAVHVRITRLKRVRPRSNKWPMYGVHMSVIGAMLGQLSVLVAYAFGHALAVAGVHVG